MTLQASNNSLNASGLVTLSEPKSAAAEAYRLLRTNVQFGDVAQPLRSLVVTSARPDEGKSSVIANLAVVFAQMDQRVILVDADLRRPTLHQFFGVPNEGGLSSYILKAGGFRDNLTPNGNGKSGYSGSNLPLIQTNVPNLRLMTAGQPPSNPAEILGSATMRELIEGLKQESDIVLFDVPPVLSVTDASILAPRVDGVILVFRAGRTKRDDSQQAKAQLQKVHAHILGAVLSDVKVRGKAVSY